MEHLASEWITLEFEGIPGGTGGCCLFQPPKYIKPLKESFVRVVDARASLRYETSRAQRPPRGTPAPLSPKPEYSITALAFLAVFWLSLIHI